MLVYSGAVSGGSSATLMTEAGVGETPFTQGISAVWAVLPSVFSALGVEATVVDRSSGQMGNPQFRARRIEGRRLSTFFDCGSGLTGAYADTYEVRMMLRVQLIPSPEGGTIVRTTVDAYAEDRNVSAEPIHCRPRGSLERRVGELIAERLVA